jgi:hypothetical protein
MDKVFNWQIYVGIPSLCGAMVIFDPAKLFFARPKI